MSEDDLSGYDSMSYDSYGPMGPELQVRENVIKYLFPVFLFIGTVGTFPCLVLMNRYSNSVWSACLYLCILFGIDLVKLYVHCGNEWYTAVTNDNLSEKILLMSNSICKVYTFLISFFNHMSSWIVVSVAVELLVAVRFPRHMYRMCTRDRSQAVILLITVLLICLNLHYFWTTGLSMPGQTPDIPFAYCHSNYELSEDFRLIIWPLVDFLIMNVIPFIVVAVCLSICLFRILRKNKQEDDEMETLLGKYFLDLKTLLSLKIATFLLCVVFLLLNMYKIILEILNYSMGENMDNTAAFVMDIIKELCDNTYLSIKPIIFIAICRKLRQDTIPCFRAKKVKVPIAKPAVSRASIIVKKNQRPSPKQAEIHSPPHSYSRNSGARPKIYKATGIGTSTGV